ncbi:4-coumarate--CoA ligase-like 1 [Psilocybe cubensis]|uniref:4-coumarate--CoA ligase-like 1 n=1 Tax=Psilocybe cubensis TaxID=181762 RepID=A0ACB8HFF4_PSICU|nr:4-coumarate--CoA ligase-like 1 [Psilocybe cubensis]KAH9486564.1 4-coumarate--CoA ligase-like 1 [Psilocybe cubensis]
MHMFPLPKGGKEYDLTIPQFILRGSGTNELPRPARPSNVPFFIEDRTGRGVVYEEAHYRTYGLANALSLKWNIGPQDVDYATIIWAVHALGGIITPANPAYTAEELAYQLSLTKAKLIAVHPEHLNAALAAAQSCGLSEASFFVLGPSEKPEIPTIDELVTFGASRGENYRAIRLKPGEASRTIAFLSFSSGTTAISHYGVIANIIQMATHYRINDPTWPSKYVSPGDVVLGNIYGLVVIGSIVVIPKFNFFDFLESIERHRITHLYLVPPQIVLFCKHPAAKGRDFSYVKFCLSGAAPLSGELMSQVSKVFPNAVIGQGYGLTETSTTICSIRHDRKLGTVGSAGELIPGITAKVVKPDGTYAKEGEQGELVVKGPNMAMGYYNNPTATAETFVDGWVRTGDEVIIKELEVFIVDRLKEILKVRGFQVAPAELEGHLLLHPDVADACVVGIPDEYSGEIPLAYVVPSVDALKRMENNENAAEELKKEIQRHVSAAKVQYKWLSGGVEFIDAIPKNPSGFTEILAVQWSHNRLSSPSLKYDAVAVQSNTVNVDAISDEAEQLHSGLVLVFIVSMKFRRSVQQPKYVEEPKSIAPALLSDPAFSPDPHLNPYYVLNGEPAEPPVGHPSLKAKNRRRHSDFAQPILASDSFDFDLIPPPNSPVAPSPVPKVAHFPFPSHNPPPVAAVTPPTTQPPVAAHTRASVAFATVTLPKEHKKRRMPFLSRLKSSVVSVDSPAAVPTRNARAEDDVTQQTRPVLAPRNASEPPKSSTRTRPGYPMRSMTVSGASTPTARSVGKSIAPSQISIARTNDLDRIDELDDTNPWGISLHHKGPYEAATQALKSSNSSAIWGTGTSAFSDYPRQALHAHGNVSIYLVVRVYILLIVSTTALRSTTSTYRCVIEPLARSNTSPELRYFSASAISAPTSSCFWTTIE